MPPNAGPGPTDPPAGEAATLRGASSRARSSASVLGRWLTRQRVVVHGSRWSVAIPRTLHASRHRCPPEQDGLFSRPGGVYAAQLADFDRRSTSCRPTGSIIAREGARDLELWLGDQLPEEPTRDHGGARRISAGRPPQPGAAVHRRHLGAGSRAVRLLLGAVEQAYRKD